jgi:hypothetical protein
VYITQNVSPGVTFSFRIRARNVYGWSKQFSFPYIKIVSSGIPFEMSPVQVNYDPEDLTNIIISWLAADNNSEPITNYEILVLQSDG